MFTLLPECIYSTSLEPLARQNYTENLQRIFLSTKTYKQLVLAFTGNRLPFTYMTNQSFFKCMLQSEPGSNPSYVHSAGGNVRVPFSYTSLSHSVLSVEGVASCCHWHCGRNFLLFYIQSLLNHIKWYFIIFFIPVFCGYFSGAHKIPQYSTHPSEQPMDSEANDCFAK